jgi:hypothetical protein
MESLECQMRKTSDAKPEVTSRIEKIRLKSECLCGNQQNVHYGKEDYMRQPYILPDLVIVQRVVTFIWSLAGVNTFSNFVITFVVLTVVDWPHFVLFVSVLSFPVSSLPPPQPSYYYVVSGALFTQVSSVSSLQLLSSLFILWVQGRPLGGAPGSLAPGADFEGAPKRRSPTGHTLIRSTVAWWFPNLQTKRVANNYF